MKFVSLAAAALIVGSPAMAQQRDLTRLEHAVVGRAVSVCLLETARGTAERISQHEAKSMMKHGITSQHMGQLAASDLFREEVYAMIRYYGGCDRWLDDMDRRNGRKISNSAETCYATTEKVAQGPHPIPKGARRIIIDYNQASGEVIVLKMGGPYQKSDFGSFSAGCKYLGVN